MGLLALKSLAGYSPGPPAVTGTAKVVGLGTFDPVRQTTTETCWAAAAGALRQAFKFTHQISEQEFAERFWADSKCPDAQKKTAPGWQYPVTKLDCVLHFAGVLVGPLPNLNLTGLLEVLGCGHAVASLMSDGGISHVVVIWSAYQSDEKASWLISVADPNGGVNRVDLRPEPYLRPEAFETGR